MSAKRWDVVSKRPGREKTYFHRVGTAFQGEKGISIKLDSQPLPDEKGEVWINLYEPREQVDRQSPQPRQQTSGGYGEHRGGAPAGGRMGDAIDDDLPF
jgi:hypothetical protein